ncbi:stalk domain-containing protein [Paenibacillaceae bacterium WGS1546]|uniref:stalk domain-containing protein n=1 Tax=Cohnella sp. WGS1546 TaxID=3366810 RepID=UPI00372D531F
MKKTILVLLSFILSLTIVSSLTTQTASAADSDYAYSDAAKQALAYINKIRAQAGLAKVELDPYLTKAAENHANYLKINKTTGHYEEEGKEGYAGDGPTERVINVGGEHLAKIHSANNTDYIDYSHMSYEERLAQIAADKNKGINSSQITGKLVSEGISYGKSSSVSGVASLINAPYHRGNIVDRNLEYIGVGFNEWCLVVTYSLKYPEELSGYSIYPFDGQKDVEPTFHGRENPDPLADTGIKQSGYIITHLSYEFGDIRTATLVEETGVTVPVVIKNGFYMGTGNLNLIIPKTPLKAGTAYTVTINGKASTFTVAGEKEIPPPLTYSKTNVGIKLDGTFITVNPTAKVVNSSTFIPLRGVLENMGATLAWDGKTQTVTIKKDATTIKLVIGSKTVHVNGKAQSLSVAPFLEKGYTFVPLRFISETFGAKVSWNATEYIASIDTSDIAGNIPSEPSAVLGSYVTPIKSIIERHGLTMETEEVNADFTYGGYIIKDKSGNKLADYTQYISTTNKGQSNIYLTEILGSPDNEERYRFLEDMIISLSGVSDPKPLDVLMDRIGREATMRDLLDGERTESYTGVTYKIQASAPYLGTETTGGSLIWNLTVMIKKS